MSWAFFTFQYCVCLFISGWRASRKRREMCCHCWALPNCFDFACGALGSATALRHLRNNLLENREMSLEDRLLVSEEWLLMCFAYLQRFLLTDVLEAFSLISRSSSWASATVGPGSAGWAGTCPQRFLGYSAGVARSRCLMEGWWSVMWLYPGSIWSVIYIITLFVLNNSRTRGLCVERPSLCM